LTVANRTHFLIRIFRRNISLLTRPSVHVTRLIVRLILSFDLEDLTLAQLDNLSAAIETVLETDPVVLRRIAEIDDYRHQLEVHRLRRLNATQHQVSGQLNIYGEEVTYV